MLSTKKTTINLLQALRAFAALSVVLFHMGLGMYQTAQVKLIHIFNFGFSGVDIFFVLSGFIIYHSALQNPAMTATQFLLRRLIRIFPIYWFILILILLPFFADPAFLHSHFSINHAIQSGGVKFFIASFLLLPFVIPGLLPVSWTLSFEMLFYILFFIFFFRSRVLFFVVLSTWVCICFITQFLHPINFMSERCFSFVPILNPIVSEFLFGCVVAVLAARYEYRYASIIFLIGAILFLVSAILCLGDSFETAAYGLPAALIVYGLAGLTMKAPRFFVYLGDASYSIYIFHLPILTVLGKNKALFNFFGAYLATLIIFFLIVIISCLAHSFIEKPMLLFCKRKFLTEKRNGSSSLAGYSA